MLNRFFALLFSLLFSILCYGQTNTAIEIKEVNVVSWRTTESIAGLKQEKTDSLTRLFSPFGNLNFFLSNSAQYIKNYGPAQLAVLSMRGGSSYHTGVLWNGINIVDPMNGTADLSLLRGWLFDDVTLQYGGSSSLTGSGNLSGSILLNNDESQITCTTAKAGIQLNSLKGFSKYGSVVYKMKKLSGSVKLFHDHSLNQYEYNKEDVIEKQKRAEYLQYGILTDQQFITGMHSVLKLALWYQYSDRNIPPTLYQSPSNARQTDDNLKTTISWKHNREKSVWNFRAAYFRDKLNYNDLTLAIPSNSNLRTTLAEGEYRFHFNRNHEVGFNCNATLYEARTLDYGAKKNQTRIASTAFYTYHSPNNSFTGNASIRKEFSQSKYPPITFSLGMNKKVNALLIRASVSSLFRNPTLNDLYWKPGGNENLQPEKGYAAEVTTEYDVRGMQLKTFKEGKFTIGVTAYHRIVNNWIEWTPGSGLWSPLNIKRVWSRGLEAYLHLTIGAKKYRFDGIIHTSYTLSTNLKENYPNDPAYLKQLIYVPVYSSNATFTFCYLSSAIRTNLQYTGYRYTSTDNLNFLDPYFLMNVAVLKTILIHDQKITCSGGIDNLMNEKYTLVNNRPMPLRTITFGVLLEFKFTNKNQ